MLETLVYVLTGVGILQFVYVKSVHHLIGLILDQAKNDVESQDISSNNN